MKASPMIGKKCYNHLGGKLGAALFDFLVQDGWIVPQADTPNAYAVTEKGYEGFQQMGLELPQETHTKTGAC